MLVPSLVGGVTVNEHIRGMIVDGRARRSCIAFVVYLVIGHRRRSRRRRRSASTRPATRSATAFNISPLNLLPLVAADRRSRCCKVPPFLAHLRASRCSPAILACFTQRDAVEAFVDEPGQGVVLDGIEAVYQAMANGFVSTSGNATIDDLFSGGGMSSMLTTVWLILGALSFAAIMEEAGFLDRLIAPLVDRARTDAGADRVGRRRPASASTSSPATSTSPSCCRAGSTAPSSPAAGWPRGCSRDGRGHRHRDLAARAVEQLRRLHDRRARRADHPVPARSPSSTSSTRSSRSPTPSPASASSTSPPPRRQPSTATPATADDPPALIPEGDAHVD